MNVLSEWAVLLGFQVDKASLDRAKRAAQEVETAVDRSVAKEKAATQQVQRETRTRTEAVERMGREMSVALNMSVGSTLRTLTGLAAGLGVALGGIRAFTAQIGDLSRLNDEAARAQ